MALISHIGPHSLQSWDQRLHITCWIWPTIKIRSTITAQSVRIGLGCVYYKGDTTVGKPHCIHEILKRKNEKENEMKIFMTKK